MGGEEQISDRFDYPVFRPPAFIGLQINAVLIAAAAC
jgi:hypothetical protein